MDEYPYEKDAGMKKMEVLGAHFLKHPFDADQGRASSAAPKRIYFGRCAFRLQIININHPLPPLEFKGGQKPVRIFG